MKKTLLSLALALAASSGAANAAPVYAQSVVSTNQTADDDGNPVAGDRSDPLAVIGPADGVFYSLGFGGDMVLDFGAGFVKAPGTVSEITFKLEGYIEKVKILVSKTRDFTGAESAVVSNQTAGLPGGASLTFAAPSFRYVKLVDMSARGYGARDGFDVDSISFSPVPVPAAGLMLAGAVAGLGALRRRAKKA